MKITGDSSAAIAKCKEVQAEIDKRLAERAEAGDEQDIEQLNRFDLENPDPTRRMSFDKSMKDIEDRYGDAIDRLGDM